jgi:hypothetical protein
MRHDFLYDGDHNLANQNRNKKMAGVLKPVVRVGGGQAHGCGSECLCLGSR